MKESHQEAVLKNGQNGTHLTRADVVAAINPHLLNHLKIEAMHEVKVLEPAELLSPARLDVMAKYIYALHWVLGRRANWAVYVYREHLRVWNEFRENDGSGKTSFDAFKESFDELLSRFSRNDFEENQGLLPVGLNNVIIDGSHRAAAALAINTPVKVVYFNTEPRHYNYRFFQQAGLGEEVLDDLALEYCRLDKRVRVAVLFPVAQGRDHEVKQILEGCGPILYTKSVILSRRGRENLIKLLYKGESWIGDGIKPTPGVLQHASQRFLDDEPVRFIFFIGGDDSRNRLAKSCIRALFDRGNDPVHINDTHSQTISIAESVLNTNSLHFLNHSICLALRNFTELFRNFKEWISKNCLDSRLFCIDGSAVLAAYGLRDANDLDYLFAGNTPESGPSVLISCHNTELSHYGIALDDLVLDPRNFFFFDGIKFVAIHIVRKMKEVRGEAKDLSDVYRIDSLGRNLGFVAGVLKIYHTLPERAYSFRVQVLRRIKHMIPRPFLPVARALYRLPKVMRTWSGPEHQVMIYRGFELHYSRGTSLLEWIEGGQTYEPEISKQLVQFIKGKPAPTCLDIGANIGLMTLNILAEVPHASVIAFEPGNHQANFLEKNVAVNNLSHRVTIARTALSNRLGTAEFSVHRSKHSSGDGFFDTRRAGRTQMTEVPVTTLDKWWESAGKPQIDAVKIDTEGAELWVLEGGKAMIQQCRPPIVFELNPKNIRVYPYDAFDILRFFGQHQYTVQTMNGILMSEVNLKEYLESTNDYVAIFKHG